MDQLSLWLAQNPFSNILMLIFGLLIVGIPFLLLHYLFKKKYDSNLSALITGTIILPVLFIASLFLNENPPYLLFAIGGVFLLGLFYKTRKNLNHTNSD
ncbi:hypothetical protein JCM9140_1731 [Halalkalibacter wakoensis JCM 9140]|uniref:Uncharacterized protein n=1 Tax=Halalkalibacter wakoensis JCM 9140 TaxID=1236970 RepID=W4Q1V2_9BACI|nr:hypothetical protein [Halalkalibacter wakoensis]GAE25723.1 hypothetical protein JCM9140_1731 [Halalkalibacter wakoensis JCM 9140]